jgi:hypothetical protein
MENCREEREETQKGKALGGWVMSERRWIQFSLANLMLAVTVAGAFSVWLAWAMRNERGLPALAPIVIGLPTVIGALIRGMRGIILGAVVGIAIIGLVFGVILLLMMLDVIRVDI